jgi:hypothetical protein
MLPVGRLQGHEGHGAVTYKVTAPASQIEAGTYLRLNVVTAGAKQNLAARFTLTVDGHDYIPQRLGQHGLRFVSIHQGRGQQFVATYARGSGEVFVPLPAGTKRGTVTAAKGFEFVPATTAFEINNRTATVRVSLKRWVDMQAEGWFAADEHLHYERTDRRHDSDWLTMLAADGLSHAHFLVLRGGNVPGIWAEQYAYGKAGEANDGKRLIWPGEEYRDSRQGHINLLHLDAIIPPISTGGIGEPKIVFNYPPLLDVYRRAHQLGGIGGPAHGASFSENSTALLNTILGEIDFFEIANSHLFKTEVWYQLLNCGFVVPPVAGTDLPNFGFRDSWQPLLGEIRTYVRAGKNRDFEAWKQAIRRGETFITSGPMIRFTVNGVGPGGTLHLPIGGGKVRITADLASPRELETLNVVQTGKQLAIGHKSTIEDSIHRLSISHQLLIKESCWLAARGIGQSKTAIERGLGIVQPVVAHTAVVQVLVGHSPIRSESAVALLRRELIRQQEFYRTKARYEKAEHRLRFVGLFDQALRRLDGTEDDSPSP